MQQIIYQGEIYDIIDITDDCYIICIDNETTAVPKDDCDPI